MPLGLSKYVLLGAFVDSIIIWLFAALICIDFSVCLALQKSHVNRTRSRPEKAQSPRISPG